MYYLRKVDGKYVFLELEKTIKYAEEAEINNPAQCFGSLCG